MKQFVILCAVIAVSMLFLAQADESNEMEERGFLLSSKNGYPTFNQGGGRRCLSSGCNSKFNGGCSSSGNCGGQCNTCSGGRCNTCSGGQCNTCSGGQCNTGSDAKRTVVKNNIVVTNGNGTQSGAPGAPGAAGTPGGPGQNNQGQGLGVAPLSPPGTPATLANATVPVAQ
uniref:Uncharacterized protein n=1 Tax=Glossina austeni TaxID=7395 RepID=A0A1A9VV08_GLOAU